jgi:hypothetical protein
VERARATVGARIPRWCLGGPHMARVEGLNLPEPGSGPHHPRIAGGGLMVQRAEVEPSR